MDTALAESLLLAGLPTGLREPLLATFATIVRNYREGRWEPSELNGGKFCEVVYSILRGHVDGTMPARPSKPRNMVDACKALESHTASFPRAVTIQIPRMIVGLYEIRNNRGVGHVGGDVDPNHMDARVVLEMSKWILADLVRIFHGVDTARAAQAVEKIVERTVPIVWHTGNVRRVLQPGMSYRDQTLLLLYSVGKPTPDRTLFEWVEHSNFSAYRKVLTDAHKKVLVDYRGGIVSLSPTGSDYVEEELPLVI